MGSADTSIRYGHHTLGLGRRIQDWDCTSSSHFPSRFTRCAGRCTAQRPGADECRNGQRQGRVSSRRQTSNKPELVILSATGCRTSGTTPMQGGIRPLHLYGCQFSNSGFGRSGTKNFSFNFRLKALFHMGIVPKSLSNRLMDKFCETPDVVWANT